MCARVTDSGLLGVRMCARVTDSGLLGVSCVLGLLIQVFWVLAVC